MRSLLALVVVVVGCGPPDRGKGPDPVPPDTCDGLECRVVNCAKDGKPPTSISGTVFAPNGTLALYGVTVYIPVADPGPLHEGAECSRCMSDLPGGSFATAQTDEMGHFTLTNVPTGRNVPLVIQIGKWRRRLDVFEVAACQDNPVPMAETRLPKNHLEGDMPKIAIVTGGFDALECLVKKLGVETDEFTSSTGDGRIHMYASNGATSSISDPNSFQPAAVLWSDLDRLKQYDLALFSCEGDPQASQKTQQMMDTLKAYADFGGRVFLSHYHNIWIAGERGNPSHAPQVWPQIATCDSDGADSGNDIIDQANNPRGPAFASWMVNVGGSTTPGIIPITEGRQTCRTVDTTKAERWVVFNQLGGVLPQNFQFTTPNEVAIEQRCGKVVFSDMHVASGSFSSGQFPSGCSASALTPQEKALAFMFFDIASCLGPVF